MESKEAVKALSALAQDTRLAAFRLLVQAGPHGLAAGVIAERLGLPGATASFHLAQLGHAGLIRSRTEGRYVIYSTDFERIQTLIGFLTDNCCEGGVCAVSPAVVPASQPPSGIGNPAMNVLFLCTGNSARSILAEAYLNSAGKGRFVAYSAGSHPAGQVNPFALALLAENRIDVSGARSKNWDEFSRPGSPKMDFVFTVCDNAAAEPCPHWPGQPVTAHWGVPDPAAVQGSDEDKRRAFLVAFKTLSARIDLLLNLPTDTLDRISIAGHLQHIGADAQ